MMFHKVIEFKYDLLSRDKLLRVFGLKDIYLKDYNDIEIINSYLKSRRIKKAQS